MRQSRYIRLSVVEERNSVFCSKYSTSELIGGYDSRASTAEAQKKSFSLFACVRAVCLCMFSQSRKVKNTEKQNAIAYFVVRTRYARAMAPTAKQKQRKIAGDKTGKGLEG